MKKSVLTAFITVVCVTSSVMAADDNAITDGSVTFNGKVIAPACTLVAATKDSVVTLPDVSATKLQTNGQVSGVQTDVPIELKDCDTTVTKNATFTFNGTADTTQITAFANQASSDAATNVALQMYMNDGTSGLFFQFTNAPSCCNASTSSNISLSGNKPRSGFSPMPS